MTPTPHAGPSPLYETFTIRWTEERVYENTLSVHMEDVRDWLGCPEDAEVSVDQVRAYLNAGDTETWHDTASRGEPVLVSTWVERITCLSRKGSRP